MPVMLGLAPDSPLPVTLTPDRPRVLVVLDGLGWDQLREHAAVLPTLTAMTGGPITTVAPSTTATALTSITTGLTPAEHGMVGYRMMVDGTVLNLLRWGTDRMGDARQTLPPDVLQPFPPFLGEAPALVTKAEFRRSGFTVAHLRGGRLTGYRTPAVLVHEAARLVREGEPFVYAYYDGVDKVAHEYGLGSTYRAELAFSDRLVADLLAAVPAGTEVIVTADHGQLDCRDGLVPVAEDVLALTTGLSGEGRFRWLHTNDGAIDDLLAGAIEHHGHNSWVRSAEQVLDEKWFGGAMAPDVRARLGDVALLPIGTHAFEDPADSGPFELVGRHGSLTSAEMLVPCVMAEA
ncbi:MAG: alkaline phosphatase family protein [Actinomycetota bacterium]